MIFMQHAAHGEAVATLTRLYDLLLRLHHFLLDHSYIIMVLFLRDMPLQSSTFY